MADYLPPEPGGSEPDLGAPAQPPQPLPPPAAPPPQPYYQHPPPPQQPPQPYYQQPPQQPQWGWQQQPPVPDNGVAVTGFVLSMVAAGLLLLSAGLSSIISIVCAGLGIYYSQKGKQRVARGETPKHAGLAQAGFISGIVTLVLSLLATIFWVFFVVLAATDEEFRRDFENDFESSTILIQTLASFLT